MNRARALIELDDDTLNLDELSGNLFRCGDCNVSHGSFHSTRYSCILCELQIRKCVLLSRAWLPIPEILALGGKRAGASGAQGHLQLHRASVRKRTVAHSSLKSLPHPRSYPDVTPFLKPHPTFRVVDFLVSPIES